MLIISQSLKKKIKTFLQYYRELQIILFTTNWILKQQINSVMYPCDVWFENANWNETSINRYPYTESISYTQEEKSRSHTDQDLSFQEERYCIYYFKKTFLISSMRS